MWNESKVKWKMFSYFNVESGIEINLSERDERKFWILNESYNNSLESILHKPWTMREILSLLEFKKKNTI